MLLNLLLNDLFVLMHLENVFKGPLNAFIQKSMYFIQSYLQLSTENGSSWRILWPKQQCDITII